jgi:hypothetical protein
MKESIFDRCGRLDGINFSQFFMAGTAIEDILRTEAIRTSHETTIRTQRE